MIEHAAEISSSVVSLDKLNRTAPRMTSVGNPIAWRTWEGWLDPLAHADPVLHAIPARSRASWRACRSIPGNAMLVVCGNRCAARPRMDALGRAVMRDSSSRSRMAVMRALVG